MLWEEERGQGQWGSGLLPRTYHTYFIRAAINLTVIKHEKNRRDTWSTTENLEEHPTEMDHIPPGNYCRRCMVYVMSPQLPPTRPVAPELPFHPTWSVWICPQF